MKRRPLLRRNTRERPTTFAQRCAKKSLKKNQKNISGDERRPYMQRKYLHKAIIITSFLLTISFISTGAALAHKGHGGPANIFMQEADALKTMLPGGGKILKRKEVLRKEKVSEAIKQ